MYNHSWPRRSRSHDVYMNDAIADPNFRTNRQRRAEGNSLSSGIESSFSMVHASSCILVSAERTSFLRRARQLSAFLCASSAAKRLGKPSIRTRNSVTTSVTAFSTSLVKQYKPRSRSSLSSAMRARARSQSMRPSSSAVMRPDFIALWTAVRETFSSRASSACVILFSVLLSICCKPFLKILTPATIRGPNYPCIKGLGGTRYPRGVTSSSCCSRKTSCSLTFVACLSQRKGISPPPPKPRASFAVCLHVGQRHHVTSDRLPISRQPLFACRPPIVVLGQPSARNEEANDVAIIEAGAHFVTEDLGQHEVGHRIVGHVFTHEAGAVAGARRMIIERPLPRRKAGFSVYFEELPHLSKQ